MSVSKIKHLVSRFKHFLLLNLPVLALATPLLMVSASGSSGPVEELQNFCKNLPQVSSDEDDPNIFYYAIFPIARW